VGGKVEWSAEGGGGPNGGLAGRSGGGGGKSVKRDPPIVVGQERTENEVREKVDPFGEEQQIELY